MNFHIARTFELLIDHIIHAGTGIHQRRRDNRQRAAFFDIPCRSKEAFGAL